MELEQYRDTVLRYKEIKPRYDTLSQYLQCLLKLISQRLELNPIIQGRAKAIDSFAEKITRPGKYYTDPLRDMTDFCGIRLITHTMDQVEKVASILQDYFLIDQLNSEDKKTRLSFREFGYLSRHYIVQVKNFIPLPGFEDPREFEWLKPLKAELQLRTLAQHIWADIYHEMGYKNEFQLPQRWEREFALVAASLENCDLSFQDIKNDISSLESNYGGYMSPESLSDLAQRLEVLLGIDRENLSVLQRLVKTYMAMSEWGKIEKLFRCEREKLGTQAPILRDVGVAICKANIDGNQITDTTKYQEGLDLIRAAIAIDPEDIETHCCLGGSCRPINLEESVAHYKTAFGIDPSNPYALGNYIEVLLLLKKDVSILSYFEPLIKSAIIRCDKQIAVKANLPWALYDLGKFNLLIGRLKESLYFYCLAVLKSPSPWMILTGGRSLSEMADKGLDVPGIESILHFLGVASDVAARIDGKPRTSHRLPVDCPEFIKPVLILSGGCERMSENDLAKLEVLKGKLADFKGTIVSGGTLSGISGIVGDIQESSAQVRSIGYLPGKSSKASGKMVDHRYSEHRHTGGADFSSLDLITFWEDYLAGGGDPAWVKLIGYNGGDVASSEYMIALALGAKVGLIAGSGREADASLRDSQLGEYLIEPDGKRKNGDASPKAKVGGKRIYALSLENDDVSKFVADVI